MASQDGNETGAYVLAAIWSHLRKLALEYPGDNQRTSRSFVGQKPICGDDWISIPPPLTLP